MNSNDRKKLDRIERALREALTVIQELQSAGGEESSGIEKASFDGESAVRKCRELGRSSADAYLADLKQAELGAIFVASGGPSTDRKKPKQWLVEHILWHIFDFEAGHNAIRSIGAGEA